MATHSTQIDADRRLLKFKKYEDYLDSLVIPKDRCYLQSLSVSRQLAELGYRSSGETLSRKEFERRLAAVIAYLSPSHNTQYALAHKGRCGSDPLQKELAIREGANRSGILATIIFLRIFTRSGIEVSGYLDYSERLKSEDWKPFFADNVRIWPTPIDLGYYHWRTGFAKSTDSVNYKVLVHPVKGLLFQNRFDRKIICVDPVVPPGANSTRTRVLSDLYEDVVIYDHVVRQRI